ncbi:MAG: MmgE/PrpD family protein [Patescibacteria group bacterium]|jgi:2-methylcitrate dehydratase PrpD
MTRKKTKEKNNITDEFIDYLFNLNKSFFSDDIIFQAKKCLLDYLGATLAGAKILDKKGGLILESLNHGDGEVKIIGSKKRGTILTSALVNGINAHVAEVDDGIRFASFHPGAPIISALLSVAEKEKLSGRDFLRGIIVGYEASIKLATSIYPFHRARGYHTTGTCGVIGSAIGVATALNLSKKQFKDSFSTAIGASSGLLKVFEDASELKPFNVGQAALSGLVAVFSAKAGFNGPNDVLSGENGFIKIMAGKCNLDYLTRKKNNYLEIEKIYFKPYFSCRLGHSAIEAVLNLKLKEKIKVENIEKIKIKIYQLAIDNHDHVDILNVSSAKMSIPYSVAVALIFGKVGINEFSSLTIKDKRVLALLKKIKIQPDKKLDKFLPQKRPTIVEIITKDKKVYSERVDLPKGEPEKPLQKEELEAKFSSLAIFSGKKREEISKIILNVWNLEKNNMDKIIKLL